MTPENSIQEKPIVRRLKLDEYWKLLPKDEQGKPASANWVAKEIGVTHNTIMYYKQHYKADLRRKKQIRQPSYGLVLALRNFFAKYGAPKDDFVEWDVPPLPISEHDPGLSQHAPADSYAQ